MNLKIFKIFLLSKSILIFLLIVTGANSDATLDQLIRSKKYSDAINYADASIPTNQRTADVWVKLGIANEELGTTEKALACYLVASRVDPKNYDALLGIARVYNKLNQYDNALNFAKKALDIKSTGEASWEYAKACMAQNKLQDAKEALEKVVQTDPTNAAANKGLAEIYWQQKEYKKAIPLLKVAYASNPNADDAYKIGKSLLEENRYDSAIYYLKEAITRNPSLYSANLDLAKAYYFKDKFLAAANEFEKVVGKVKMSGLDHYYRAICHEKTGSPDLAINAYQSAAKEFGKDNSIESINSHLKAGKADLEKKNYESALAHFQIIVSADPDESKVPDIQFLLADAYYGLQNNQKAISCLEKALAKNDKNVEAYARLADLYQKSGNTDKAKQIYEKMIAINPNDPAIFLTLGDYGYKSKKYSEALKNYEKSYLLNKSAKAAVGMALCAFTLEQIDKAIDAAESAIRLDPSIVEAREILAKAYFKTDRYKEAKDNLDFLVGKKPFDLEYWKLLAYCYKQLNDPVNMAYADKKVIELDKTNVESRLRLGAYLLSKREYKQAFDIYKELSELTPQNPEVFKNLYEIAASSGDKAMAANYLKKYLSFNPTDAEAYKNLGNLYYEVKNFEGALSAFKTAIKIDPKIKGVYKPLAEIIIAKGPKEELESALLGAVNAQEADGNMYSLLGGIYQRKGNCKGAIDLYQKALSKDPKNLPVIFGLAKCQAQLGNIDDAIISYEQALAFNPDVTKEYKELGELYVKKNKNAEASEVFKKYLDKVKTDNQIALFVGDYAYKNKKYSEAIKYYELITGEEAKNTNLQLCLGTAYFNEKKYDKAEIILKDVSIKMPNNAEILKMLYAISAPDSSKRENSIEYLKKYTAIKPNDVEALKNLAELLYNKKDVNGALLYYRKTIAADPSIKGIYKRYFELATSQNSQDDINAALKGAIAAGEADAGMYTVQGNIYSKKGLCDKAIPMYQKALSFDPKNTVVLFNLAECQTKTNNIADATITYEQVIALSPKDASVYKKLGDMYLSINKKDQAVNTYKKYLEKQSDENIAYLVGEYAFNKNDYNEAIKYFGMISGEKSKTTSFLSMYAKASLEKKDFDKAKELYLKLLVLKPQDAEIAKILYTIASKDPKQKEEAISYLKKYVALKPNDADAQKELGDLLYDKKDFNGAIVAYKKCVSLNPSVKGVYKKYFEIASQLGLSEDVPVALKGAIATGEADASMYNIQGIRYQKAGKYQQAIEMFSKALSMEPRNAAVLNALADCQVKSGNTAEACITYEQIIAINPQDTRIYKILAELYLKDKKTDQAFSVYKKYLDKEPKDFAVAYWLGETSYNNKKYSDAIKYFEMIESEYSRKTSYISMYASACLETKNYKKAEELYKKLATLEPADPTIYKALCDINLKNNDSESAISNLKKYLSLKPQDAEAQKALGDYYYEKKELSPAFFAYRAALMADPTIKGVYKRYSELVISRGTPDEVLKVLTNAIKLGEADAQTYAALGSIYEKKEIYQQAISNYQKSLEMDQKNTKVLSALARCQLKSGKHADALITYQQVVTLNPDAVEEYKILGDLYMKQNKRSSALDAYKKYLAKGPDDAEIAMLLAEESYNKKNYEETILYLNKAQKQKTNDIEYLNLLGRCYYYSKNYRKSQEILERMRLLALEKKTTIAPLSLKMLAESYENNGNNQKAVSIYEEYTKLPQVNDPEACYKKALLAESVSPALAAKYYEENAQKYPKDYRNYFGAGMFYAKQQGQLEKAAALLKKALSLKDTLPVLWLELGKIYNKLNKTQEELSAYQNYIQRDPSNPEACIEIGINLMNKRLVNEAMVYLEMANALKPNTPEYMYQLARGYIKADKMQEAVPLLEKAEKLDPNNEKIKALYNYVLQKTSSGGVNSKTK